MHVNQAKEYEICLMKKKSNKNLQGYFTILNDRGLHCRPSTEIVKCAILFKSDIFLHYQNNRVNAKSLFGILMLAASKGAKIKVEASGDDAKEAIESLQALAAESFKMNY